MDVQFVAALSRIPSPPPPLPEGEGKCLRCVAAMFDITIIDSLSGAASYSPAAIAALLAGERTPLRSGGEFVGRPVTAIHVGETAVAKLRTELTWEPKTMERWVRKTLERERELQVHHPGKTWFLARRAGDDQPVIGNITPRLKPLNQILAAAPADPVETEQRLAWFAALFAAYFRLGLQHGVRLDEGLSNFGLSADGALYYLDDDLYRWDDGVSLSHGLGTWFRAHSWFGGEFAAALGDRLRAALGEDPQGVHFARLIVEHLRGLYLPQPDRQAALEAFGRGLLGQAGTAAPRPAVRRPSSPLWAILGDVHANLPALEAVLAFLRDEGITEGLVLGDSVGYGPHPGPCIERLAESGFAVLKGNHDHAAVAGLPALGLSAEARWALEWTASQLAEPHRRWLDELPLSLAGEGWLAVHGAPMDPGYFNGYVYEMTYDANLDHLAEHGIPLCFHGHTHVPGVYARLKNNRSGRFDEPEHRLGDYRQALVCPGSVGQPRNRQPGTHFALWNRSAGTLRFVRLAYDLEATLRAMHETGFPQRLRDRLTLGT
jgi:predicted phosphodiesterase